MENIILKRFKESIEVKQRFLKENLPKLLEAVNLISQTFEAGNKVFFFGNGGSAADAQHIAAEFVNRFVMDRPPLPAMALTTDTSILTSISNDIGFNETFSRQLKAHGKEGDVAVGISTSGNSPNVLRAFEVAYTDFTELVYAEARRKAYLMPIVDHASKLVLGWAVGAHAETSLALEAWGQASKTLRAQGVNMAKVIVHHDQDPVFTGYGWTWRLLLQDKVRVSYALNGAKDNPEMEAFNSRFKTENRSLLLDAQTLQELQALVAERMDYYNRQRRHSSIGYRAPMTYIASLQPWT